MAELGKVSPNRMELLKNRRRLALAKRGHKLLKDKYDELIRRFLALIRENRELRNQTEQQLRKMYEKFTLLRVEAPKKELLDLIEQQQLELLLELTSKNLLNTQVPVIEAQTKIITDQFSAQAPLAFDIFVEQFEITVKQLLELAQFEQTVRLLAAEIEKTRRRVNALEHVLIPQLSQNIAFISMRMDEIDRETRTRLMKTKELLVKVAR